MTETEATLVVAVLALLMCVFRTGSYKRFVDAWNGGIYDDDANGNRW